MIPPTLRGLIFANGEISGMFLTTGKKNKQSEMKQEEERP